jgi:hypothetical protein
MKNVAIGIIILIIMGFAAKELIISKATTEPEPTGYKFYYYPKLNMYYDATQNNFVYTVDGGLTWQTKKASAQNLPEKMDEKVILYSPDPDAWIHNTSHRQQYNGVYTNYVQRREDTARFIPEPVLKREDSVSTDSTARQAAVEKEEKGGSWFKRLKAKIKKGFKRNKETPLLKDSL